MTYSLVEELLGETKHPGECRVVLPSTLQVANPLLLMARVDTPTKLVTRLTKCVNHIMERVYLTKDAHHDD